MDKLCYAALDILAIDEEELDIEEYRIWIGRFNTIESEYVLAETYLSVGEFTNAMVILNSLPVKHPDFDEESYQNYLDYFAVRQAYYSLEEGDEIPSHLIEELVHLSNNDDFVAIKARSFGEIIVDNWAEYYAYTFEIHPACVCNSDDSRNDNDGQKSMDSKHNTSKEITTSDKIEINIYPNPANNTLYIKLDKFPQMAVNYTLYDIQGKELLSGSFEGQKHEVNISHISKGIYFIRCTTENQPATVKKVIKE